MKILWWDVGRRTWGDTLHAQRPTPNVLRERGFSLIELMLTVSFVLLGTMLIQGSFLRAADMFGRYSHTLKLMSWMDRESARTREELLFTAGEAYDGSGVVDIDGKQVDWSRQVASISSPGLYSVRYTARWTESGRPFELKSEMYAYKKDPALGS